MRATVHTCVIAPCSSRPQSKPSVSCSFSPSGRAERWAKGRARGARMVCMRAPRMTSFWQRHTGDPRTVREKRHTGGPTQRRECDEPDRHGSKLSPAFRTRMDLSACWMSQGLEFLPPPPVRASCRPDIHSSRPPVSPVSVPLPPPWTLGARCQRGPSHPAVALRRQPERALKWSGMTTKYSYLGIKSKILFQPVDCCEMSE